MCQSRGNNGIAMRLRRLIKAVDKVCDTKTNFNRTLPKRDIDD